MNNCFLRPAILSGILFSASVAVPSIGYCKGTKMMPMSEKAAVKTALNRELGRSTSDHVKMFPYFLTSLEVRSNWALATVQPTKSRELDPATVLLHKTRGKWKVVTLGSNLHGAGKQFNVPRSLWSRWNLGA
ncbi:hypothetical protein EON80_31345 [bacterium]|nr:MAG: hypothetical protein EON80_31345 [bacterium]